MSLKLFNRKGVLYIRGAVHFGQKRRSVYESTKIRAREPGARETARAILQARQAEIREELEHGPGAAVTFLEAAARYDQRRRARLAETDPRFDAHAPLATAGQLAEIARYLARKGLAEAPLRALDQETIDGFFRERHLARGNSLATARRHARTYTACMNYAVRQGWAPAAYPRPDLGAAPKRSKPAVDKYFLPDEIQFMIEHAPPHFRPIVALGFATGRRTSELAWLARPGRYDPARHSGELRLSQGDEHLLLEHTKNTDPILVYLPDWVLPLLHAHLAARDDSHAEMFLTPDGVPYLRPRRQQGGVFKTAWATLRRALRRAKLLEARTHPIGSSARWRSLQRAHTVAQSTPHWFRHNMASHLYMGGASDKQVQDHGGWRSLALPRQTYGHLSTERRKETANMLDFGVGSGAPAVHRTERSA